MKQFIISLLIIFGLFYIYKDEIIIPKDAIRLRVIANSNSEYDQNIKNKIKNSVENNVYNIMKDETNFKIAKEKIKTNIPNIDKNIKKIMNENNYSQHYSIKYGQNFFPQKKYKGIIYDEGYYESLVITLGEGKGNNWWCVMFPPFCLIEAQNENTSDVEYKWLVKEMLDKYF